MYEVSVIIPIDRFLKEDTYSYRSYTVKKLGLCFVNSKLL